MKKGIYVVIAFFSLGLLQMNAQVIQGTSSSSSDMRFGVKGGLNLATLGGSTNLGTYSSKPGVHLGVVLEIPFSDTIIIQPEALVSLQGTGGYVTNENLNLWYVNVPVMAKYNVWEDLSIEAGPYLGVLLGENTEDQFSGLTNFETNTIDFGLAAGAGYRLDDNFYFQLRFNAGFINALKDVNSKNRVFQVSAVYFL
ncbi:porin family protein [uncultured Maribacter sp.]|uniref:porin family protein n=1 Tax=uncultured Maribacter sp. TaxID=431308 RepID=UPI00260534F3|nr:porin family protein [uncultured Maribacter sp.]